MKDVKAHMKVKVERRIDSQEGFEERVATILQYKHRWRWRILWVWIAVFSGLAIFLWHYNNDRVGEIKKQEIRIIRLERIEHCIKLKHTFKYCEQTK